MGLITFHYLAIFSHLAVCFFAINSYKKYKKPKGRFLIGFGVFMSLFLIIMYVREIPNMQLLINVLPTIDRILWPLFNVFNSLFYVTAYQFLLKQTKND